MSSMNKKVRKRVLLRDGYKCKKCGIDTDLTVHHIKPRCSHPLLKNKDWNLITLCENCHRQEHYQAKQIPKGRKKLSKEERHFETHAGCEGRVYEVLNHNLRPKKFCCRCERFL